MFNAMYSRHHYHNATGHLPAATASSAAFLQRVRDLSPAPHPALNGVHDIHCSGQLLDRANWNVLSKLHWNRLMYWTWYDGEPESQMNKLDWKPESIHYAEKCYNNNERISSGRNVINHDDEANKWWSQRKRRHGLSKANLSLAPTLTKSMLDGSLDLRFNWIIITWPAGLRHPQMDERHMTPKPAEALDRQAFPIYHLIDWRYRQMLNCLLGLRPISSQHRVAAARRRIPQNSVRGTPSIFWMI